MGEFRSPADEEQRGASIDRSIGTPPPPVAASDDGSAIGGDGVTLNATDVAPAAALSTSTHGPIPEVHKQVDGVLKSEIGISTLLSRLKHSIASAREFGTFLKKRATLEEDNASSLKKVCRMTQDSMRRPEHRTGTFLQAYDDLVYIHERMAENGSQFATSLQQMHDDLVEMATTADRGRKNWKTNGLSAEQKVADMEQTMRKSKAKYDSLAEDYERVKTGEGRQSGKVFNAFKNKSGPQAEEELLRKVQAADSAYHGHVQTLQTEKSQLERSIRPDAVKNLQDLINEVDSALALQMQRFASFSEKLLLANGISVSPISGPAGEKTARSLRNAVMSINNERDLNDYVSSQASRVPQGTGEVKYERNRVLAPQPSHLNSVQQPPPVLTGPTHLPPVGGPLNSQPPQSVRSTDSFASPGTPSQGPIPPAIGSSFAQGPSPGQFTQPHNRSFSQGNMQPPGSSHQPTPSYGSGRDLGPGGPPQLGALPFQSGPAPPHMSQPQSSFPPPSHERHGSGPVGLPQGPGAYGASPPPQGPLAPSGPPAKPVFGIPLDRLYERDGLAVPLVVYQCLQAVDMFGLAVEGIYRQSGSMNHIKELKTMFDNDSSSKALDFRNPENFFQDVNSVTSLLKQFLRDLPDPLLTHEHHDALVAAAKHDDEVVRRDSLHAIINALPDPNYATLRALCLHLHRIMDNAHQNRMNGQNLAVIFGPTLMGTDPSKAIADAGWQIRVIMTILENTYQIFDED